MPSPCPASSPYWASPVCTLYLGDAATVLRELPAESVDLCVTSPPFWSQRDYKVAGQIGLEPTPDLWLENILAVFREVRRVLRPWGTLWCEIGDSYASNLRSGRDESPGVGAKQVIDPVHTAVKWKAGGGSNFAWTIPFGEITVKPLDLVGIPFRLALALQAEGWWLRSVIIWDKPSPMPESVAGWRWQKCRVKVKKQAYPWGEAGAARDAGPARNLTDSKALGLFAEWADCPGCPRCSPNGGLVLRKGSWRPTESHSYILMLAKGVPYFSNGEAVRIPLQDSSQERVQYGWKSNHPSIGHIDTPEMGERFAPRGGANLRSI